MPTDKETQPMTTTVSPTTEATTPLWRGINHLALVTTNMDATVRSDRDDDHEPPEALEVFRVTRVDRQVFGTGGRCDQEI